MSDTLLVRGPNEIRKTAAAALAGGEMHQLADGRAGYLAGLQAAALGDRVTYITENQVTVPKAATYNILDGGRVYWDKSANVAHYLKVNDGDFYIGRAIGDAALADTTMVVNLNVNPRYDIDLQLDGFLSVPTGTKAAGAFGYPKPLGGAMLVELTATSEAQCIDLLSVDRFAVAANAIVEAIFRVPTNGTGSTVDFNIGLANGTSTTDADAITESVFLHVDGGSVNLLLESDDGTTEVNATDSTIDLTAGSAVANRVEVWFDTRNPADIQIYINGVLMLGSTIFTLGVAVGPMGLLVHLEKTTGTETGIFVIDRLCARYAEQ